MKKLKNIILEKLVFNKHTKSKYSTYTFINDDYHFSRLTVNLPFKFYFPEIDEDVQINKIIEEENDYGEKCWDFFIVKDNEEYKVVRLSSMGVYNIFIKQNTNSKINKVSPLIHHITTGSDHHIKKTHKNLQIELSNPYKTIVDESKIDEKLVFNKHTKEKQNIFWFTNNKGIKLPFDIYIPELKNSITITNIEHTKPLKKDLWKLYDKDGNHIFTLYELVIQNLFFNKYCYQAILRMVDPSMRLKVKTPDYVLIEYKDDLNKILQESINESQDEPKRYSNMILMNPDEDEILILRRANYMRKFRTMWGFPGGSIDQKDKDSKAAAVRELKEETGIELTFNEERKCKKFDSIKNEDGSISDYWIATLEAMPEVKLSREHSKYEWFNEKNKEKHKWMPDVFQIIQKIL